MKQPIGLINIFKDWCDENIKSAVGLRRTSLELFNETINNSYTELKQITGDNCKSYTFAMRTGNKMCPVASR